MTPVIVKVGDKLIADTGEAAVLVHGNYKHYCNLSLRETLASNVAKHRKGNTATWDGTSR